MKMPGFVKMKAKKGFTLIESLVAFSIIAAILTATLSGFNTLASLNSKTYALNQTDEKLEALIATNETSSEAIQSTSSATITLGKTADGSGQIDIPGKIHVYKVNGKTLSVFVPN